MTKQIKSKKRVADFGEVYTNEREVNAMLDLVKRESTRPESRFLEPACGNGNFLIKILERKLKTVRRKYRKNQFEYERYCFIAISSIYAIDILEDNVEESRERLFKYFEKQYKSLYKTNCSDDFKQSVRYVLKQNIILGDGLTGLRVLAKNEPSNPDNIPLPIMFSEWNIVGNFVKRCDYAMCDMLAYEDVHNEKNQILKPRKEYELIHYREVGNLEREK